MIGGNKSTNLHKKNQSEKIKPPIYTKELIRENKTTILKKILLIYFFLIHFWYWLYMCRYHAKFQQKMTLWFNKNWLPKKKEQSRVRKLTWQYEEEAIIKRWPKVSSSKGNKNWMLVCRIKLHTLTSDLKKQQGILVAAMCCMEWHFLGIIGCT